VRIVRDEYSNVGGILTGPAFPAFSTNSRSDGGSGGAITSRPSRNTVHNSAFVTSGPSARTLRKTNPCARLAKAHSRRAHAEPVRAFDRCPVRHGLSEAPPCNRPRPYTGIPCTCRCLDGVSAHGFASPALDKGNPSPCSRRGASLPRGRNRRKRFDPSCLPIFVLALTRKTSYHQTCQNAIAN